MALLIAGCVPDTGDTTYERGTTRDYSADDASGSLTSRSDGGRTLTLSRDGTVCSGRFDDPAKARATELTTLRCSGDARGTATLMYDGDAEPDRVVYAINGQGGGSIEF
ncbi:hypothetical protein [Salipiger pallidus]|uniref:hypothetical protein n=1 Tax=Salipiger pallidus TaxID=1775170 RepID=UPI001663570C|nr:hypothetical protein [Salipiger pallidus]